MGFPLSIINPHGTQRSSILTSSRNTTLKSVDGETPTDDVGTRMPEVVFNVQMSCGGCSGACTRILQKLDGVSKIDPDLETQKITVEYEPPVTPEVMLEKLQVWGKTANKSVSLA